LATRPQGNEVIGTRACFSCQLRTSMHAGAEVPRIIRGKRSALGHVLAVHDRIQICLKFVPEIRASCGWSRRWPRSVFRQVFMDRGHSNRPSHCSKSLFKSDVGAKSFSQLATQTAFGVGGSVSFGAAQSSEKSAASKTIGVLP
jgi:hypothetical protein